MAVALIGGASPAAAAPLDIPTSTAWFVNCAAKTNGNGTAISPWNSVWAVNTHGAFAPGDSISFRRGTTCKGRLIPKGSGLDGAVVTMGAYGSGGKPTIAGGGTTQETATLTLKNLAYWTVQDLHITNRNRAASTSVFRSGVLLVNDSGGELAGDVVQRLTIDNVTSKLFYQSKHDARDWGGISVHTLNRGSGDGYEGLRIVNNIVTGVGRTGIVTSNREYPGGLDHALRIGGNIVSTSRGDGIIMRGAADSSIDHNTVKNNSNMWPCSQCMKVRGMGANAGIWPTLSRDSVIEKNNVYGTHVGHGDGEGIDLDIAAERIVVQYNYLHDNDGGGVLFCGSRSSTVRFNILENNKKSAVAFIGSVPARNSSIYNNTVYAVKQIGAGNVRTFNGYHGAGIKFFNNIVYNFGSAGWTFPAKVWARSNTFVGTRGIREPTGAGSSHANPKLKHPGKGTNSFTSLAGYKPKSGSKAQRGIAIPASVSVDFFGKKIDPKHPPRGAAG